jgi:hypothetical protein
MAFGSTPAENASGGAPNAAANEPNATGYAPGTSVSSLYNQGKTKIPSARPTPSPATQAPEGSTSPSELTSMFDFGTSIFAPNNPNIEALASGAVASKSQSPITNPNPQSTAQTGQTLNVVQSVPNNATLVSNPNNANAVYFEPSGTAVFYNIPAPKPSGFLQINQSTGEGGGGAAIQATGGGNSNNSSGNLQSYSGLNLPSNAQLVNNPSQANAVYYSPGGTPTYYNVPAQSLGSAVNIATSNGGSAQFNPQTGVLTINNVGSTPVTLQTNSIYSATGQPIQLYSPLPSASPQAPALNNANYSTFANGVSGLQFGTETGNPYSYSLNYNGVTITGSIPANLRNLPSGNPNNAEQLAIQQAYQAYNSAPTIAQSVNAENASYTYETSTPTTPISPGTQSVSFNQLGIPTVGFTTSGGTVTNPSVTLVYSQTPNAQGQYNVIGYQDPTTGSTTSSVNIDGYTFSLDANGNPIYQQNTVQNQGPPTITNPYSGILAADYAVNQANAQNAQNQGTTTGILGYEPSSLHPLDVTNNTNYSLTPQQLAAIQTKVQQTQGQNNNTAQYSQVNSQLSNPLQGLVPTIGTALYENTNQPLIASQNNYTNTRSENINNLLYAAYANPQAPYTLSLGFDNLYFNPFATIGKINTAVPAYLENVFGGFANPFLPKTTANGQTVSNYIPYNPNVQPFIQGLQNNPLGQAHIPGVSAAARYIGANLAYPATQNANPLSSAYSLASVGVPAVAPQAAISGAALFGGINAAANTGSNLIFGNPVNYGTIKQAAIQGGQAGSILGPAFAYAAPAVASAAPGLGQAIYDVGANPYLRYLSGTAGLPLLANIQSYLQTGQPASLQSNVNAALQGGLFSVAPDVLPKLVSESYNEPFKYQGVTTPSGNPLIGRYVTVDEFGNPVSKLALGTPSYADLLTHPQFDANGNPISPFPTTTEFNAKETATGASSNLILTPTGRAIFEKSITLAQDGMPVEADYALSGLKVAQGLSNQKLPNPGEFKLDLKSLDDAQNAQFTDDIKTAAQEGKIEKVYGSLSLHLQAPEEFRVAPNLPPDVDVAFKTQEDALNFAKLEADAQNKIVGNDKYTVAEHGTGATIDYQDENGATHHIGDFHVASTQPNQYGLNLAGQESPLGIKQTEPVNIENVPTEAGSQTLKNKLGSALSVRAVNPEEILNTPEEWQKYLNDYLDGDTKTTLAPGDWRIKDVVDSYVAGQILNDYNLNPISKATIDANLEAFKTAAITKFGLTDADFATGQADLTPILTGENPSQQLNKAVAVSFQAAQPVPQQTQATYTQVPSSNPTYNQQKTIQPYSPYDPLSSLQQQYLYAQYLAGNSATDQNILSALQQSQQQEQYNNYLASIYGNQFNSSLGSTIPNGSNLLSSINSIFNPSISSLSPSDLYSLMISGAISPSTYQSLVSQYSSPSYASQNYSSSNYPYQYYNPSNSPYQNSMPYSQSYPYSGYYPFPYNPNKTKGSSTPPVLQGGIFNRYPSPNPYQASTYVQQYSPDFTSVLLGLKANKAPTLGNPQQQIYSSIGLRPIVENTETTSARRIRNQQQV